MSRGIQDDAKQLTATELLMAVAERMNKYGEGEDVLVVWNHGKTAECVGNCNYTRALGLAQYAVAEMEDSLISGVGGDIREEGGNDKPTRH